MLVASALLAELLPEQHLDATVPVVPAVGPTPRGPSRGRAPGDRHRAGGQQVRNEVRMLAVLRSVDCEHLAELHGVPFGAAGDVLPLRAVVASTPAAVAVGAGRLGGVRIDGLNERTGMGAGREFQALVRVLTAEIRDAAVKEGAELEVVSAGRAEDFPVGGKEITRAAHFVAIESWLICVECSVLVFCVARVERGEETQRR